MPEPIYSQTNSVLSLYCTSRRQRKRPGTGEESDVGGSVMTIRSIYPMARSRRNENRGGVGWSELPETAASLVKRPQADCRSDDGYAPETSRRGESLTKPFAIALNRLQNGGTAHAAA